MRHDNMTCQKWRGIIHSEAVALNICSLALSVSLTLLVRAIIFSIQIVFHARASGDTAMFAYVYLL